MNNSLDIFILGSIITFSIAIASIVIFSKRNSISCKRLLISYLLVLTILNITTLILSNYKYVNFFKVGHLGNLLTFTLLPITYLYIKCFVTQTTGIKSRNYLHLIPFLLIFIYHLFQAIFSNYFVEMCNRSVGYKISEVLISGVYLFYIIRLLKKVPLKENPWLYTFFISALLIYSIKLSLFIILLGKRTILAYSWNMKLFNVVSFIFIIIFLHYLLRDPKKLLIKNSEKIDQKMVDKILKALKRNDLYRTIDLNLGVLAKELNMGRQALSNEINKNFNLSYYQLINKLRIEHCLGMMKDPRNGDLSITDYQYELGYSSKSSFFKSFKEVTNTTPLRYKKSISGSKSTIKSL